MAYKFNYTLIQTEQLFDDASKGYSADGRTLEMIGNTLGINVTWIDASIDEILTELEPGYKTKNQNLSSKSIQQNIFAGNIMLESAPLNPANVSDLITSDVIKDNIKNGNLFIKDIEDVYTTSLGDIKSVTGKTGPANYFAILVPEDIEEIRGGIVGFDHSYIADIILSDSKYSTLIKGDIVEYEGQNYKMYAEYYDEAQAVEELTIADPSIMKTMIW